MVNVIKNTKKDYKKKHMNETKIFLKKEKVKYEKRLEKDITILLKKKKKKDLNIIWNVKRSYLTTEEITI